MKTLIQIVVVALLVGGLSAGGSYYMQQQAKKAAAAVTPPVPPEGDPSKEKPAESDEESADPSTSDDGMSPPLTVKAPQEPWMAFAESLILEPPAGVRPPYLAESDEAGALINKLRSREATTTDRERRLIERQETMELILGDMRDEQSSSAKIRQRYFEVTNQSLQSVDQARRATDSERGALREQTAELKRKVDEQIRALQREKDMAIAAADEAVKSARSEREAAEQAVKDARVEREDLRKQLDDLNKPADNRDQSGLPGKNGNLKKLATVLDGMPPENTAKILKEMVKKGSTDGVVVLLNAMKPRISAKVLSTISDTDPILAADLTERLKQYKLQ